MSSVDWNALDHQYMARAIQLARRGWYSTQPNPRVGCVLVKQDRIIAEGWHEKAGEAHAEVMAIVAAGDTAKGASCYVSLEPCHHQGRTPPCTDAVRQAGIQKVIAAIPDPNPKVSGKGIRYLNDSGVEAHVGLMSAEAELVNPGFLKRMRDNIPRVRCKLGTSLDGKVALANGVSQWITSDMARQDVQRLRAESCAVITGIETILADDPSMNVRAFDTGGRQPLRVILDSDLRTPGSAKILTLPGDTLIFTCNKNKEQHRALTDAGAHVVTVSRDNGHVCLQDVLSYLASEKEINDVLLEAGPVLSGAFINAGLVDELIIYQAGIILGDRARDILSLGLFESLDKCIKLKIIDERFIGKDRKTTYQVIKD